MTDRQAPPVVVNVADVEPIVRHPEGGGTDWPLLHARSAGTEHVFSGYLRNYVRNTGDEDLVIVYAISPKDRYET